MVRPARGLMSAIWVKLNVRLRRRGSVGNALRLRTAVRSNQSFSRLKRPASAARFEKPSSLSSCNAMTKGRKLRRAEPIVADHALFVGIGNGALFQDGHGRESLLDGGLHGREKVVGKGDAADIHGEAEISVVAVVGFEA